MSHIIMCRLCKKRFDTEVEPFVLVGKKSYYHKTCYDDWVKNRNDANTVEDEMFWQESVIDYLYRDVQLSIDFAKFQSQWVNFTKPNKKMTPKGIYFALRYFYEVLKGDKEKAQGGIGIAQNVYQDSANYWTDLEMKKSGTIDAIIRQIKERAARPIETIVHKAPKKEKTAKWSLDSV